MSITVILEAFIVGMAAAATLLYAFQTKITYPKWMMKSFDHPWILLLALIVAVFSFKWMPTLSVLVILLIVALWMDGVLFSKAPLWTKRSAGQPEANKNETNEFHGEVWPYDHMGVRESSQVQGPTLANIGISEPTYPTFFGTDLLPPGPAPFN